MQEEPHVGRPLSPYNRKYTLAEDAIKIILKHQNQYVDETDLLVLRGVCTAFKNDVDKIKFFTHFFLKKVLLSREAIQSPLSMNIFSTPTLYSALVKAFTTLDKSVLEEWHCELFNLMLDCLLTEPNMVCRLVEICYKINLVSTDLKTFGYSKKIIFDFLTKPIPYFSRENESTLLTYAERLHQEGGCSPKQYSALQMSIEASYAQLRGDNLLNECYCYKNLSGGNFINAILVYANFEAANLKGARFNGAKLSGANFDGANLSFAHFDMAKLHRANFRGANLEGASFRCAKLESAHLQGANLKGANFLFAQLQGANLEKACLDGAGFQGSVLACTNLGAAHLENVDLANANLTGANFEEAYLRGVNLIGANFSLTKFNGANCEVCTLFLNNDEYQQKAVISKLRKEVEGNEEYIAPLLFNITAESLSQLTPECVTDLKTLAMQCLVNVLENISFNDFFGLLQNSGFIHSREGSIFGYSPIYHRGAKDTYPQAVKLVTEAYIRLCERDGFDEEKAIQHDEIRAVLVTRLHETKGFFAKAWDKLIDQLQKVPFINGPENEHDTFNYGHRNVMRVGVN